MAENALTTQDPTVQVVGIVVDGLTSEHSKRAYRRALTDFLTWRASVGNPPIVKATVQRYAAELAAAGVGPSSINQRLSAIRKLASEAADNALLAEPIANGIANVKGVRQEGRRSGNWLTREQAQDLINAPDVETLKGLRDRALLAVLVGCGLRRQETTDLTFAHIQQRDGRWVIVDMLGKRGKMRTVPMPSWCKAALDAWTEAAGISEGCIFRSMDRWGRTAGESMTPQAVRDMVVSYTGALGLGGIAPHDLRRSYAKLAHKGGSPLDQIQLSLGHASIQTTERYLGVEQDLTDAPCDRLGLRL